MRASALVVTTCHALSAVPWQELGRRVGLPWSTPSAREVVVTVPAAVVCSAAAMTLVRKAARRVAGGYPGRGEQCRGAASPPVALAGASLSWVPVLGPYAATAAELAAGRRLAREPRGLLAAAVLVAGRVAAHHALRLLLAAGAPASPAPATPATSLNLRPAGGRDPAGFVVYFDGVGRVIPRTTPVGRTFAAAVAQRLPDWTIVMSLMPNDVTQQPAWRRPVTGPLWRAIWRRNRGWLLARGVWEAVVALDGRYRPRLAADHTASIVSHVLAAGYAPGSGAPVVLVGLSAGAQTALSSASDVARALGGAPLDVVTLGGFLDGGADLSGVRRVHAAVSWGDPAELAPVPFLRQRWTALGVGRWSRARRDRTVVLYRHDFATHVGRTGYLGEALCADGRTRLEQSADLVTLAARELTGHRRARAGAGGTGTP